MGLRVLAMGLESGWLMSLENNNLALHFEVSIYLYQFCYLNIILGQTLHGLCDTLIKELQQFPIAKNSQQLSKNRLNPHRLTPDYMKLLLVEPLLRLESLSMDLPRTVTYLRPDWSVSLFVNKPN